MKDLDKVLSDSELDQLDQFLLDRIDDDADTKNKDEGIVEISMLDGFLAAVVSGPEVIVPSSWLPAIWGDFPPDWKNEKEFETIFSLIVRHMNGISGTLMDYPEDFEPIVYHQEVNGKVYITVDEWCEGYARGMDLAPSAWETEEKEIAELLAPILAFTEKTKWRGHDLDELETEKLQEAITPNVRKIHAYWLARREEEPPTNQAPYKRETKVGRNEPCPCGSGKKFKQCCLH